MIHARPFPTTLAIRDTGETRTLEGPLLPWGVEARVLDRGRMVVATFQRGALAGVEASRVPLTARHPRDAQELPIGVTVELEERTDAAWGAWRVSDTALGDEVLELARDGVPLGLSIGFMEIPGGSIWSPDRRRVTRTRAALDHVAVSECPPTPVPGWSAFVGATSRAPPRHSSPWPGCAMGKGSHGQGGRKNAGIHPAGATSGAASPAAAPSCGVSGARPASRS